MGFFDKERYYLKDITGQHVHLPKTYVDARFDLFVSNFQELKNQGTDQKMGHQIFWYVFNPRSDNPTVKHTSYKAALHEAKRLGKLYPAMTLHVLECVATVSSETKQIITEAVPEESTEL